MKPTQLALFLAVALSAPPSFAQSSNDSVRVQAGHFCHQNKCVRFSRDLGSVSIQGRRPVSIAELNLANDPVVSSETFREIFHLALRQSGVHGNRG